MVQNVSSEIIPEELYNLTQLAEVTLAAGRLSTTNVNEITEYINKEKTKEEIDYIYNNKNIQYSTDNVKSTKFRRRHTIEENWNRNIEDIPTNAVENSSLYRGHSVIKRNHSASTILDYENEECRSNKIFTDQRNFLSSSDDDSNYYSHKIFDRKKSRRSTISDNSRYDELSCSSIPSSSDEQFIGGDSSKNMDQTISEDDHVCPECGKKYSTSSNLARHRQTHRSILDKKARHCPHCDKVYVSMPAYSMHVRTHNQGCECPHCGKCFSRPWLLQGHIRTHTGEKPFKCNICSKAFADKSNLRAHIQTHSNTKPHACSRCGKSFALKSYLYKHEESSCMRNFLKQDKDRLKTSKFETTTKATLVSKLLRKDNQQQNNQREFSTSIKCPSSETEQIPETSIITEEKTQKSYTNLTSAMSQDEFDRFTRISVIRTPISTSTTTPATTNQDYDTNEVQLNFYQENPVNFSPNKNNFTHSTKTSPFELANGYAILA